MSSRERPEGSRPKRADAVRNTESVLAAAKAVFSEDGVDAPMRAIATRAGVGVGTIYRNYPQRTDLIIAVFRSEVDATAADAEHLGDTHPPAEALRLWAAGFGRFIATKRGLSSALHSGDPAYAPLPSYFLGTLGPAVQRILDAGARDGTLRGDVRAEDVIHALSRLTSGPAESGEQTSPMTDVLLDGLTIARSA